MGSWIMKSCLIDNPPLFTNNPALLNDKAGLLRPYGGKRAELERLRLRAAEGVEDKGYLDGEERSAFAGQ